MNQPAEIDDAFIASPEMTEALEAYGSELSLPAHKELFTRGENARGLFLIKSGSARLSVPGAVDRVVGPGSLLGVPGTLSRRIYSLSAQLLEESRVLFVPSERITQLMKDRPEIGFHMVQILSREIQSMRDRMARLA